MDPGTDALLPICQSGVEDNVPSRTCKVVKEGTRLSEQGAVTHRASDQDPSRAHLREVSDFHSGSKYPGCGSLMSKDTTAFQEQRGLAGTNEVCVEPDRTAVVAVSTLIDSLCSADEKSALGGKYSTSDLATTAALLKNKSPPPPHLEVQILRPARKIVDADGRRIADPTSESTAAARTIRPSAGITPSVVPLQRKHSNKGGEHLQRPRGTTLRPTPRVLNAQQQGVRSEVDTQELPGLKNLRRIKYADTSPAAQAWTLLPKRGTVQAGTTSRSWFSSLFGSAESSPGKSVESQVERASSGGSLFTSRSSVGALFRSPESSVPQSARGVSDRPPFPQVSLSSSHELSASPRPSSVESFSVKALSQNQNAHQDRSTASVEPMATGGERTISGLHSKIDPSQQSTDVASIAELAADSTDAPLSTQEAESCIDMVKRQDCQDTPRNPVARKGDSNKTETAPSLTGQQLPMPQTVGNHSVSTTCPPADKQMPSASETRGGGPAGFGAWQQRRKSRGKRAPAATPRPPTGATLHPMLQKQNTAPAACATAPISSPSKTNTPATSKDPQFPSSSPATEARKSTAVRQTWMPCAVEIPISEVSLNRVIGKGATSSVYRAEWRGFPVACKLVTLPSQGSAASRAAQIRQVLQDFHHELNIMLRLGRHPNLIQLKAVGTQSVPLFMVTELCSGGSLFDFLHGGPERDSTKGGKAVEAPGMVERQSSDTSNLSNGPVSPNTTLSREESSVSDREYRTTVDIPGPHHDPDYEALVARAGGKAGDGSSIQTKSSGRGDDSSSAGNQNGTGGVQAKEKTGSGGFWSMLWGTKEKEAPKHPPTRPRMGTAPVPWNISDPGNPQQPQSQGFSEDILFSRGPKIPLSWSLRARIALDLAKGCAHLHSLQFIHRDIKSLNVLLTEAILDPQQQTTAQAKLADFGCTMFTGNRAAEKMCNAGGWAGTVLWMAPETLSKEGCNEKSDVYSFGIVLYELLTNRIPFQELQGTPYYEQLPTLIPAGLRPNLGPRALPPDVPSQLRALMEACWRKEPAHRPPFVHLVRALEVIVADLEARSRPGVEAGTHC
ncbi:tyrosine kinase-like protein [Cystoisospora suis]|uniref:Tyrosine kinase-like protein n=1 Tax=Cystoisospora suis TaxID=483139 RepID=A0A2C6KEL4_9APIC|nr:tyrosine kinase-like protein [Cystoisospora suis]